MKISKLFILIFLTGIFSSCENDESLDPIPVKVNGTFVYLDITSKVFNIDDAGSFFGGNLTAPGNNVSRYDLYVRLTNSRGSTAFENFVKLKSISAFPVDLKITLTDIADKLNVPVGDLGLDSEFRFYGESFDSKGVKSDFNNLSTQIRSNLASYKPAYRFRTVIKNNLLFFNIPGNVEEYDNYVGQ